MFALPSNDPGRDGRGCGVDVAEPRLLGQHGHFAVIFLLAVVAQVSAEKFRPFLYWATIIATTTVGTTLADFVDRSLGIGYAGGSLTLFALLMAALFTWHRALGSIAVDSVSSPKAEAFYWVTIMFSQTLGTALGDWTADTASFGYTGVVLVFGTLLEIVAAAYYWTKISWTALFWAAFILTRPLGAVVGDFLDKPRDRGGLALSRYTASATLFALVVACIVVFPQKVCKESALASLLETSIDTGLSVLEILNQHENAS
jgi:uncharacterized membrane-anchored protein